MSLASFLQLSAFSLAALLFTCLLVGLKVYCVATCGMCKSRKRLDGKVAIVTGANTGIGFETALDLAGRGAKVILACRNPTKAAKARDEIVAKTGNGDVLVRELDLASLQSVRKFAKKVLDSEPKLDILINNAGCAMLEKSLTQDGLEYQMQSNHFGHFLLTHLLLGLLVKTENSRIVNVSALAHKFIRAFDVDNLNFTRDNTGTRFFEIYSTTKLCNILFTRELAHRIKTSGYQHPTVNALHPGIIKTEFGRFMGKTLQAISCWIQGFFLKSAKEGAQTTIHLAVSDEVAGVTGEYYSDCQIAGISKVAQDDGLAKKLYDISEAMVHLGSEERFF